MFPICYLTFETKQSWLCSVTLIYDETTENCDISCGISVEYSILPVRSMLESGSLRKTNNTAQASGKMSR